jgi:Spy/CpxP family protein refolding chaperone
VNSWKVIFATIVIFGAGVITGGLLVNHVQHPSRRADELPAIMRPEMFTKQFVKQLDDKLNLTKEQSEQIQNIIAQGQKNVRDLWKIIGPQVSSDLRDTREQIRAVLTPEQRKQFELLMKLQHQMRHPQETNSPPVAPSMPVTPTNAPTV